MLRVLASTLCFYKDKIATGLFFFIELHRFDLAKGEPPLTATFFVLAEKNPYIDSCLKPLYNGHFLLSPTWPL